MEEIMMFLQADAARAAELMQKYPDRIPVNAVAEFLGCAPDTVRAWIESGAMGLCEKKIGKQNRAFLIPTAMFLRWYLRYGLGVGV